MVIGAFDVPSAKCQVKGKAAKIGGEKGSEEDTSSRVSPKGAQ